MKLQIQCVVWLLTAANAMSHGCMALAFNLYLPYFSFLYLSFFVLFLLLFHSHRMMRVPSNNDGSMHIVPLTNWHSLWSTCGLVVFYSVKFNIIYHQVANENIGCFLAFMKKDKHCCQQCELGWNILRTSSFLSSHPDRPKTGRNDKRTVQDRLIVLIRSNRLLLKAVIRRILAHVKENICIQGLEWGYSCYPTIQNVVNVCRAINHCHLVTAPRHPRNSIRQIPKEALVCIYNNSWRL